MTTIYKPILIILLAGLLCWQRFLQHGNEEQATGRVVQIKEVFCDPNDPRILVNAHRGDWRHAPENSLRAIRNVIAMGADIVEIDIRKTRDGVLVLMHDATVDRTTNGQGYIHELDYDSIGALFLRNGAGIITRHKVPTLKAALLAAKDHILIQPDYKCTNCLDDIAQLLKETGTDDQVVFGAKKTLQETKDFFGDLFHQALFVPAIDGKVEPKAVMDEFAPVDPQAYVFKFEQEDASHLEYMTPLQQEARIWVQTIQPHRCGGHSDDLAADDPDQAYGWLIDKGADIFLTDRPGLLLDYLRKRQLHD
ncbi:MAG: glycerophosphodiester phosphodiesterase family protein [Cytophagales bacterium]|nr:glycerophosphodiester phosphodiesterase family protein [Cytophagales bacterium]